MRRRESQRDMAHDRLRQWAIADRTTRTKSKFSTQSSGDDRTCASRSVRKGDIQLPRRDDCTNVSVYNRSFIFVGAMLTCQRTLCWSTHVTNGLCHECTPAFRETDSKPP